MRTVASKGVTSTAPRSEAAGSSGAKRQITCRPPSLGRASSQKTSPDTGPLLMLPSPTPAVVMNSAVIGDSHSPKAAAAAVVVVVEVVRVPRVVPPVRKEENAEAIMP